jgi:hypothetical protein
VLGLAAITLTGAGLGTPVDNVIDGDGIAALDHTVAAHRALALTSAMNAVTTAGRPCRFFRHGGPCLVTFGPNVLAPGATR